MNQEIQKHSIEGNLKQLQSLIDYPVKNRCYIDQCLFNYKHSLCCAKCSEQNCTISTDVTEMAKKSLKTKECIEVLSLDQPIRLPLKMLIHCDKEHGRHYYPVDIFYIGKNFICLSFQTKQEEIRTSIWISDLLTYLKEQRLKEREEQIRKYFKHD